MRKIFVAIALIAGLGTSSVAFANAKRHYKIFCVNGKYGIQNRVPYFLFYTFTK